MKRIAFETTKTLAVLAMIGFSSHAASQHLKEIRIEPAEAIVGEEVRATVYGEKMERSKCGLRLNWGEGKFEQSKVNTETPLPQTFTFKYKEPGTYKIHAEGELYRGHFKCSGHAYADVVVKPRPASATPICPKGWTLDATSHNKKTGAYACKAATGTTLPREKKALDCGDKLYYYEKKGMAGCQPG